MKLTKELKLIHVFCIAAGAMISSGIFVLPGMAHAKAGPAVVFSYFLAGILALFGLLSIAELTTAMPKAGGDYFYISRGLGQAAGTVAGLLSWFSLSLKSAFALIGIALLLEPLVNMNWRIIAVLGCIVFVLINLRGTKEAANLQVALVLMLLGLIVSFVAKGSQQIEITYFKPFVPYGFQSVFATAGFVFVSYGGLIQVASIAGEIKKPGKVIPLAMVSALLVIVSLYVLMVFVTSGVLGSEELDASLTPISDAAQIFWGRGGYIAVSIAAALAFLTTANAGIMTASRYLLALGRDNLLPQKFARIGQKHQTPYFAVLFTGIVISAVVFVNLYILVEAASIVFLLSYMLASIAVIVLRESKMQNYQPSFRSPFYPWVQIVTLVAFSFVLFEMGEEGFVITTVLILLSFATYWFYGRKNSTGESALLHLLERITARELVTGSLENELKQIIRQRDEIETDPFDHMIESAPVLDYPNPMQLDEFFSELAEEAAKSLPLDPKELSEGFKAREAQGSTALNPHVAVPHFIVSTPNTFKILLARCKGGIRFSEESRHVTAVFALVISSDQRNLFLKTLAAIAQTVQQSNFHKEWMQAKNPQALRDLILLTKRKRV